MSCCHTLVALNAAKNLIKNPLEMGLLQMCIFMVLEWNSGASSFCARLSVTLWQKILNLGHNLKIVRDRYFIFGMYAQLMKLFQMTPKLVPFQGGHGLWKTGKMMKKNSLHGKIREFEKK